MTPEQLAQGDFEKHQKNGVALNPFSAAGARYLWALGFEGHALPWSVNPESIYVNAYKRGQAAAKLSKVTA